MSDFSDYLEAAILDYIFLNVPFTPPDPVYISLHTGDPADTGANEVDGANWTDYARIPLDTTNGASEFDAASAESSGGGQEVDNNAEVDFGTATVSGTQADVTYFGVWDALSGGNFMTKGALSTAKPITNGDGVKFSVGNLKVALR